MLPKISQAPGVDPVVTEFLAQLTRQGFTGDSATAYADRLTMATDNSIYQLMPDAVIFPRSTDDVALIGRLTEWSAYRGLTFTRAAAAQGLTGNPSTAALSWICRAT
ncbi:hypothetical protein SODG_002193 [Sodalis praecaptivus]